MPVQRVAEALEVRRALAEAQGVDLVGAEEDGAAVGEEDARDTDIGVGLGHLLPLSLVLARERRDEPLRLPHTIVSSTRARGRGQHVISAVGGISHFTSQKNYSGIVFNEF